MKKNFKNNIYIFITLFFIIILFKNNKSFQSCILNGTMTFFQNVFPSLFPMFIINDILMNYNFYFIVDKTIHKLLKKLLGFSNMASYIFVMSMFSGTPTNAYLTANLVKENKLSNKDASIILSYSCFLNPLFLYNMLNLIFKDSNLTLKLMLVNYGLNFVIAFLFRKYPYENKNNFKFPTLSFSKCLSKSLKRSIDTLLIILGTIIFYFILCEGFNYFINFPYLNCFINGILEATGGLIKLNTLNINIHLKAITASIFILFCGLSIHTQIKNIIADVDISSKYFVISRIFCAFLAAIIFIIT